MKVTEKPKLSDGFDQLRREIIYSEQRVLINSISSIILIWTSTSVNKRLVAIPVIYKLLICYFDLSSRTDKKNYNL